VRGRAGRAGHLVGILVVVAAATYLFSALFDSQAFLSHENLFVYIRADQVAREFRAGHFPQAFPDAVNGAGFAFPRFYPPLSLWLSAWMSMLVGDTCLGVNLTFLLSVVASALAMYFCVVSVLEDRWIAVAASLVYISAPYRFVDIFVRGALAEAWTFAFYPIVVAGLWHAAARRRFKWYLPVGVGALLVTHNITALYFLGFCAVFCVLAAFWHGWRGVVLPSVGLALGLGLAVWFLAPQQVYMRGVWVSDPAFMWADADHVNQHRVMPWQLFYSLPGRAWFGESYAPQWPDQMSFELGAGAFLALVVVLLVLRRRRAIAGRGSRRLAAVGWATVGAWGACVLFMVVPVAFLWPLPRQFAYIQFPWRMLAPATFLSAFALAVFARRARFGTRGRAALLAASVAIVAFVPGFERSVQVDDVFRTDATVLDPDFVRPQGELGFTVLGEYLPREFDVQGLRDGTIESRYFEAPWVEGGEGSSLVAWSRNGLDFDAKVSAPGAFTLAFPLVYYDFYRVEADGHALETFSSNGFLAVRVPAGATRVAVCQRITPVYRLGFAASGCAALATVALVLLLRRRRARLASSLPYVNPETALE
jgi:hypothetical protein